MEESLCRIEICTDGKNFIAKVETELGGLREFRDTSLNALLRQLTTDLREEFETASL